MFPMLILSSMERESVLLLSCVFAWDAIAGKKDRSRYHNGMKHENDDQSIKHSYSSHSIYIFNAQSLATFYLVVPP
jgi:hypothetical protein